jgi:hypothetical protein
VPLSQGGYCVKCPQQKYSRGGCDGKCTVFGRSGKSSGGRDKDKKNFIDECVKQGAFTSEGELKKDYKCTGADMRKAMAALAAF